MSIQVTPKELEREMKIDARRIRRYLRNTYSKALWTRWVLTDAQADSVRDYFAASRYPRSER